MRKTETSDPTKPKTQFMKMKFLKNFINAMNMSYDDCSELLGVTRANISYLLNSGDDMRLSDIRKIIESKGYRLQILMTTKEDEMDVNVMDEDDFILTDDLKLKPKPLSFLTIAMRRYGITREELASRLGLASTSISYWLNQTQDMWLSRILQCAQVMNLNVKFTVVQAAEPPRPAPGELIFATDMHIRMQNEIGQLSIKQEAPEQIEVQQAPRKRGRPKKKPLV